MRKVTAPGIEPWSSRLECAPLLPLSDCPYLYISRYVIYIHAPTQNDKRRAEAYTRRAVKTADNLFLFVCCHHHYSITMPSRKQPAASAPTETRAVGARGQEWKAEKLTGNRAQKGNLPGGAPRWTYEVKWEGTRSNNTYMYEPATCLVGWGRPSRPVAVWGGGLERMHAHMSPMSAVLLSLAVEDTI